MYQSLIMYIRGWTKKEVLGRRQQKMRDTQRGCRGRGRGATRFAGERWWKQQLKVLSWLLFKSPPQTRPIAPRDFWEILSPCKQLIPMDMNGVYWPLFPEPPRVKYFFQNGCHSQAPTVLLFSLMFSLKWLTFPLIFFSYILNNISQSVGLI